MAQVINTNILSLTAQRNLNSSQGALATSLERLSSGLRINSAKDDAAGLAISERFSTQIRGLNQAIRNANDGISLSQTAEGALGEISANLQRVRELAVQSVNATNSDSDRAALNQEVQQRLSEVDRIASQTSFNGRNVLDGSFGSALFQVGANVGETIGLDLETSVRTAEVGATATATSVDLNTLFADPASTDALGTLTPGGVADTGGATFRLNLSDGVNSINIDTDVSASDNITAAGIAGAIENSRADIEAAGFTINGADATEIETNLEAAGLFSRVDGTNFTLAASVENGTFDGTDPSFANLAAGASITTTNGDPDVDFTVTDLEIQFGDSGAGEVATGDYSTVESFVNAINTALGSNGTAILDSETGELSITSGEAITIGGATDANAVFGVADGTTLATGGSLNDVNVLTVDKSNEAIQRIDAALNSASDLRSTFGAIQNRFESTISNLAGTTENLDASRSRIQDADFAAETAALTRAQILQQAGISVLSQANAQPQNVLALLN
ncbi:MAG: flagellin [Chromatocurvus sp.]